MRETTLKNHSLKSICRKREVIMTIDKIIQQIVSTIETLLEAIQKLTDNQKTLRDLMQQQVDINQQLTAEITMLKAQQDIKTAEVIDVRQ